MKSEGFHRNTVKYVKKNPNKKLQGTARIFQFPHACLPSPFPHAQENGTVIAVVPQIVQDTRLYFYLRFCCLTWNIWALFQAQMYSNGCLATGHWMKTDLLQLILHKSTYNFTIEEGKKDYGQTPAWSEIIACLHIQCCKRGKKNGASMAEDLYLIVPEFVSS